MSDPFRRIDDEMAAATEGGASDWRDNPIAHQLNFIKRMESAGAMLSGQLAVLAPNAMMSCPMMPTFSIRYVAILNFIEEQQPGALMRDYLDWLRTSRVPLEMVQPWVEDDALHNEDEIDAVSLGYPQFAERLRPKRRTLLDISRSFGSRVNGLLKKLRGRANDVHRDES